MNKENIITLRNKTNASFLDCKNALIKSKGNIELAISFLTKQGLKVSQKTLLKKTNEGIIESYIHFSKRIGSIIELHCETDFVAKNKEFNDFAKDLCMHIVGNNPLYINKDDISHIDMEQFLLNIDNELTNITNKDTRAKIKKNKIEKIYIEKCLLEQPFIKNPTQKVKDVLNLIINKLGENIIIKNFKLFKIK